MAACLALPTLALWGLARFSTKFRKLLTKNPEVFPSSCHSVAYFCFNKSEKQKWFNYLVMRLLIVFAATAISAFIANCTAPKNESMCETFKLMLTT